MEIEMTNEQRIKGWMEHWEQAAVVQNDSGEWEAV